MTEEQAFGIVLRKYRKQLGISQEELAFRCELDRSFISLLERGIQSPSMKVVSKLAIELGVRASTMISEAEVLFEDSKNN
ncbi:helix-turn-helix domain-containing protein [Alicyclobacillus fodiniaquatilis]|uniref:Helix-turn-helix domain-containing protein n=1 Tax=Alicyclobacillus fodiniaquatilis TaxID=1661150 RepID=A0ABW4JK72_9BACL